MIIESSVLELKEDTVFNLRRDYGSTWDGTVTLKDCTVELNEEVHKKDGVWIMCHGWVNHNFGYTCHIPSILIDNLTLTKPHLAPIYIVDPRKWGAAFDNVLTNPYLGKEVLEDGSVNNNVVKPPEFFKVVNNKQGLEYLAPDLPIFENTKIEGIKMFSPENEAN